MSEDNWKYLTTSNQNQYTVRIQFNNERPIVKNIDLRKKDNKFTLPVPADAVNKSTEVKISFGCPEEIPGKFKLSTSKEPLKFILPGHVPSVEKLTAFPSDTVLKGKKVHFTAEGCAKNYIWSIDGAKTQMKGENVSWTFEKAGPHKVTVYAEDNPGSKKEMIITAVDVGIKIKGQGAKKTVIDKSESFTAEVGKVCLPPSKIYWEIEGPIDLKTKQPLLKTPAEGNGLLCKHLFRLPGIYSIKVIAKYDKLPRVTVEDSVPWVVDQPAKIVFSDSMKPDKHTFNLREEATLAILVKEGKIDEKTIVWKANGVKISSGNRKVTHTMKEPGLVNYSVEVKDAATGQILRAEIAYSFGCSHVEPIVKALRRDGSSAWGVGEEVEFKVTPVDQYTDLVWKFGDSEQPVKVTNGQNLVHRAFKSGKFVNILTCKCRKCGTVFTKELKTETQYREPKPRLTFKPDERSFEKDEGVVLCDSGKGDYFKCRLLKLNPETGKFEEYKTLERNFEEEINLANEKFQVSGWLSGLRTDLVFKIQALNR